MMNYTDTILRENMIHFSTSSQYYGSVLKIKTR